MTLRLTHEGYQKTCPECCGLRKVPAPATYSFDGRLTPGSFHPIPCPECRGRGWVLGAVECPTKLSPTEEETAAAAAGVPQGADLYYAQKTS